MIKWLFILLAMAILTGIGYDAYTRHKHEECTLTEMRLFAVADRNFEFRKEQCAATGYPTGCYEKAVELDFQEELLIESALNAKGCND